MNSESGLIVVSSSSTGLDREMTESLNLLVEATDENGKGLRSTVPLIINLLDVNDNAPIFEKPVYEFVLNSDRTNFTNPAFIRVNLSAGVINSGKLASNNCVTAFRQPMRTPSPLIMWCAMSWCMVITRINLNSMKLLVN